MRYPEGTIRFFVGDILYDGFDTGILQYLPLECAIDDLQGRFEICPSDIVLVNGERVSRTWYTLQPSDEVVIFDDMYAKSGARQQTCGNAPQVVEPSQTVESADKSKVKSNRRSRQQASTNGLLTISDVSEIVGCSYGEARKRMLDGRIQTVKDGRWMRTRLEWVDEYLERQIVKEPEYQPEENLSRRRKPKTSKIEAKGIGLRFLKNRES